MKTENKETFIINIKETQNSSWQGNIFWTEKNITKQFRSELELIKLIDSAFDE